MIGRVGDKKCAWTAGRGTSWQVQELERRSRPVHCRLLAKEQLVHTPLQTKAWQLVLADHPDRQLVEWMVRGIRQGFRVGFQCDPRTLRQAGQNLTSLRQHPDLVQGDCRGQGRGGRQVL